MKINKLTLFGKMYNFVEDRITMRRMERVLLLRISSQTSKAFVFKIISAI